MANFWCATQHLEVHMSASRLGTMWKWILSKIFSWFKSRRHMSVNLAETLQNAALYDLTA